MIPASDERSGSCGCPGPGAVPRVRLEKTYPVPVGNAPCCNPFGVHGSRFPGLGLAWPAGCGRHTSGDSTGAQEESATSLSEGN